MAVLVIDDEEISLFLVTAALEQLGVTSIQVAKDGLSALQLFDRLVDKPEMKSPTAKPKL